MRTLDIQAVTESGSVVYASIYVRNDYTMNEIVTKVKERGFKKFRLVKTMNVFVAI